MVLHSKPILKWFGYSRRERRSTFLLLIIIVLVLTVRYIVPEKNINIEDIPSSSIIYNDTLEVNDEGLKDSAKLFTFDPKKGSVETLRSPGLNKGRLTPEKNYNSSVQSCMVDLNKCDSAMLERLPGIGTILSARIIKYRNLLGGFFSTEQLKEVYGLSRETYNLIADRVFADSSGVKHININSAGYKDFIRHPYFERYDVQAILKFRELNGRIDNMTELTDNKILTVERARRISPYISFEN